MVLSDYEKIVRKHFCFTLKKDLKIKQVSNIMQFIANDILANDIIGFYDTGFMKNGKSGFLITKDAFFDSNHNVKIPFKGLTGITYKKEGSVTVQTTFHYADGSVLTDKIIIASPEVLIEILDEIAKQYNEKTDVPEEKEQKHVEQAAAVETVNYEELGFKYYNAGEYEKAYHYLMKGVEEGNAKCMNKIGLMYYYGKHVDKDYAKALEWYDKSGNAGFSRAYGNIGYYYEYVERNDKEGFAWYEKGALAGDAYCQYMTGVRCENGADGVPQDYFKAWYWYTRSAEQNCARAYYYLGCMYKKGNGIPKDLNKAFEYFEKGAELGDKQAKEELAVSDKQAKEKAEVPAKPKTSETEGKELVEKGYNYQEGKGGPTDFRKAYECFEKAVQLNYAPAYYYLAYMHKKGLSVPQSNEKACEYLMKGAELNDMRAMDELIKGTAQDIYLPSKDMLKKMLEYGKTVLAGDFYFKPFVERIEVLATIEGSVEAYLCFTDDDLSNGVICPKCGKVLYPIPGKKQAYCTSCFSMVKAENVKRNQQVIQEKTDTFAPAEKAKLTEKAKTLETPKTLEAPKKQEQTLEEKLQKIDAESGTSKMYQADVRELREALAEEADDAYFEDEYESAIEKFKVLALFEKHQYYLQIAECYYLLDKSEEAIKWADQVNISAVDASEMSGILANLADVYYEEDYIGRAYQFAKLAADGGDEGAKELLEAIEEEYGKFELPKQAETTKQVEVLKPVEVAKVPETIQNLASDTRSDEAKIEDIKKKLEKIREEWESLKRMDYVPDSIRDISEKQFLTKLAIAGFDLEWVVLSDFGERGYYYVKDRNQAETVCDGTFDSREGDTNEKRIKMYNNILNKQRTTFATQKVEKRVSENILDNSWADKINLAILGKNERDKAIFMTNIIQVLTAKKNAITVSEIMHKKSTEYVACVKKDLPEYQLNLIDCINDPGCVRVMLNSSVDWNAVIIEYDFDDANVERNADLLSGWAYWAEYAKIPCLIVYIKMPSLEQDDDLELLLDYMKEDIYEYIASEYNGEIVFIEGLVSEKMEHSYGEDWEAIMDMMSEIKSRN